MPWTRRISRFSDDIGPLQAVLNIVFILMIVLFFLIAQAYRTSLDTLKAEIADLDGGVSTTVTDEDGVTGAEGLLREVSTMDDRLGALGDRVETLASKSVDVRSMEALRDEMLLTRDRLTAIESGIEALDASAQDDEEAASDGASDGDAEEALTEARAARDELRRFKTLLGYGEL